MRIGQAAGVLGVMVAAALMAGCGQVPLSAKTPSATSVSAASREEALLYGAFFKGRITAIQAIPVTEDSTERRYQSRITIEVEKPTEERMFFYHGKLIVVAALTAEGLGLKLGDRVSGFANYPTVNDKTMTFVNKPGREPFVMDLKRI